MTSVVVIADDLTGAADSGVAFAARGLVTLVVWDGDDLPDAQVLVFSSESRHVPPDAAVMRVRDIVRRIVVSTSDGERPWVVKKVDSTLRGYPGLELATVMEGLDVTRALVAPAYPAQGRVTVAGRHYVHGVPLADSPFGREVLTSDVVARFAEGIPASVLSPLPLSVVRQGAQAVAARMRALGGVVVADAETDADLEAVAEGAIRSGIRLFCGSAGLSGALTRMLSPERLGLSSVAPSQSSRWQGDHVLAVAASRHPQTLRQVEVAGASGISVIAPDVAWYFDADGLAGDAVAGWGRQLASGSLILTTQGLPDLPGQAKLVAERLAEATRTLLDRARPAGLVLTGGDVAIAVGRCLGAHALRLQDEVCPGIPWGYLVGGVADGIPVVTKAGGFGDDDALVAACEFLWHKRRCCR